MTTSSRSMVPPTAADLRQAEALRNLSQWGELLGASSWGESDDAGDDDDRDTGEGSGSVADGGVFADFINLFTL